MGKMVNSKFVTIAEIFVFALFIYALQVSLEYLESFVGLKSIYIYLFNAPLAAIIIALVYTIRIGQFIPKVISKNTALFYVSVQFIVSNILNGFYIQSLYGSIYNFEFLRAIIISVLVFFAMYFVIYLCLDIVSKLVFKKTQRKQNFEHTPVLFHDDVVKGISESKLSKSEESGDYYDLRQNVSFENDLESELVPTVTKTSKLKKKVVSSKIKKQSKIVVSKSKKVNLKSKATKQKAVKKSVKTSRLKIKRK